MASNLDEAYLRFTNIPALKAVYDPNDELFARSLLVDAAGVKDELPFYRIWAAAATYLELSPAIHRVTKHDRTTLSDYAKPIAALKAIQVAEDRLQGIELIDPAKALQQSFTVAIRPGVEFYG